MIPVNALPVAGPGAGKRPAALSEAARLLVPGGRFACVVNYYAENEASHGWPEDVGIEMTLLDAGGWRDAFERAGLEVVEQGRLVVPADLATAAWHTHGAPNPAFMTELFSPMDLQFFHYYQVDGYLGTPMGRFWEYELANNMIYLYVAPDGNEDRTFRPRDILHSQAGDG